MNDVFGPLGAILTIALGLLGLLAPLLAGRMVGLKPEGPRGLSELRATYGGLFAGLGLACLVLQAPAAYAVAACAWLGAALARLASMALDRNPSWLNAGGLALEFVIGVLMWTGAAA
ncbi:MAG: DUF4345 family protein [Betaproteobacteria bacterium]